MDSGLAPRGAPRNDGRSGGEDDLDGLRAQPKFARRINVIWVVQSFAQKYFA